MLAVLNMNRLCGTVQIMDLPAARGTNMRVAVMLYMSLTDICWRAFHLIKCVAYTMS